MTISAGRPLWRKIGKDAASRDTETTSPSSTTPRDPGKALAGTGVVSARSSMTERLFGRAMRIGIGWRPPPRWE